MTIKYSFYFLKMSIKKAASNSPPTGPYVEPIVIWLEVNVRKPLEGSWFDTWIATPAKTYYIAAKRRD